MHVAMKAFWKSHNYIFELYTVTRSLSSGMLGPYPLAFLIPCRKTCPLKTLQQKTACSRLPLATLAPCECSISTQKETSMCSPSMAPPTPAGQGPPAWFRRGQWPGLPTIGCIHYKRACPTVKKGCGAG